MSLSACALVEAPVAIFDSKDFVRPPNLSGLYESYDGASLVIDQRGGSYRAVVVGMMNKKWLAAEVADFDAIALDGQDLALQIRCAALRDEKHPSKWNRFSKNVFYGIAAAARSKGSYWFSETYSSTLPPELARKNGIQPQIDEQEGKANGPKQEIVSGILIPRTVSKAAVIAFLTDWKNASLAHGAMEPVWRQDREPDEAVRSAAASPPECSGLPLLKTE